MRTMLVAGAVLVAAVSVILALTLESTPPPTSDVRTAVCPLDPRPARAAPDVTSPPPRLPSLLGRPGDAWAADLCGEPEVAAATVEKLARAGVDAVPLLAALILHPDPRVRWGATDVLQRLSEIGGFTAVKTLLVLAELAGDPDVRERSVRALGKLGSLAREMVVPVLIVVARDRHDAVRIAAAEALGLLGGAEAADALRVLRREDAEMLVRLTGTDALLSLVLGSLETGESVSDRSLIGLEIFESAETTRQREVAANLLGRLGPEAAEAIPVLAAALRREWIDGAIDALAKLGIGGIRALADLLGGDGDLRLKRRIIQAIGGAGREAEPVAHALIGCMKVWQLGWSSAEALGKIGGPETASLLFTLLDEPSWTAHRSFVTRALTLIGDERCIPVFTACFRTDGDLTGRLVIAGALGRMGERARSAVPVLIEAMKETKAGAPGDMSLIMALGQIGGPEAVDALLSRLCGATQEWDRIILIGALGGMGADARPAVAEISRALDHGTGYVRMTAIASLGRLGPAARAAVPALRRLLDDPEPHVRRAAASALAAIQKD